MQLINRKRNDMLIDTLLPLCMSIRELKIIRYINRYTESNRVVLTAIWQVHRQADYSMAC